MPLELWASPEPTFARVDGQTRFTMSLAAERPQPIAMTEAATERETHFSTTVAAVSPQGESRAAAENSVRD